MKSSGTAAQQRHGVNGYVESDILAPFEYSKTHRRCDHLNPEEKLMFAILTDAIFCFQKYFCSETRRCRKLFDEAESWIMSQDNSSVFSFEDVCDALCLDPNYLRLGLTRWRADNQAPSSCRKRIRAPLRYQRRLRNSCISA